MPTYAIPIGGVVRAITYCTVPGQVSTNTHKWQLTNLSSGTSADAQAFCDAYDVAMQAAYLPLMDLNAEYYGTQVYLMNPIGLPPRPATNSAHGAPGTGTSGLLPTQTCGLISLKTSTLGKIGQGRTYLPFPSVDFMDPDGTPNAGYNLAVGPLLTLLESNFVVIAGGVTATFRHCLYRGGTDVPRFIDDAVFHDAWATQRRRGSYGRLNKVPF